MNGPDGLAMRQVIIEGAGPWMWRADDEWAWHLPMADWPALRDLVLQHTVSPRAIVQAGGCMGMYPRLWANHFDTVYTFEPDPVNFYCLVANCPSGRIIKMQAALGAAGGVGSIQGATSNNAGYGSMTAGGIVPVLRLDDLALPSIDVMQLDCEGGEDAVIAGALDTIARSRPVISVETPSASLRRRLDSLNYTEVGRAGRMPDVVFRRSDSA